MRRLIPCFLLLLSLAYTSIIASANITGDTIVGYWMDASKETKIRVYKVKDKYYARVLWVENESHPGKPLPPDEQKWINMVVMRDFVWKGHEWSDGYIYQPKTDKTYTAFITPVNANTLKVTGYVMFRFLSESAEFHRVAN